MALTIREMDLKDFMGVISLVKREMMCQDISSDIYDRIMKIYHDSNYTTFVAELDGSVVGFVSVMQGLAFEKDGVYVRVIALAVKREYAESDVGMQLVGKVEDYALELGASSIVMSSGLKRTDIHAVYQQMGYEKSGYSLIKLLPTEKKETYDDLFSPIPPRENN